MAVRSGLGAQLGAVTEAAYGTYLAPTRFFPFTSEGLELQKEFVKSAGLRAGQLGQSQSLHKATTRSVEGTVVLELLNQGFGILFNQLHGDVVAPVQQGVTPAYLQTHNIGLTDPWGKSLTLQVGRPDTGGTVRPFSYVGSKLTQVQIAIAKSGLCTVTLTIDGRDEDTGQALAVATYDADSLPFDFTEMVAKVDTVAIANVEEATITIPIGQKVDRHFLGSSGVKGQPIANQLIVPTVEATLEFEDLDDHDRFKNETVVELALEGTGDVIDGAESFECKFTAAAAKQISSGPTVEGPDVIAQSASFECLANGTDAPLQIEYKSTDSAL